MELTDTVEPWVVDPPDEICSDAPPLTAAFEPLPKFVHLPIPGLPSSEGRLIDELRDVIKQRDANEILSKEILSLATVAYHGAMHPTGAGMRETFEFAAAVTDLAVTGREAYKSWRSLGAWPENEASVRILARSKMPTPPSPANLTDALTAAFDRAYIVAWALRGPAAYRTAARKSLGWLAVSGEDDSPHRPVNVPGPRLGGRELEQFEIPVTCRNITVQTRFFIASAVEDAAPAGNAFSPRALPRDPEPRIPSEHQVILFLHGHSSSAEEALDIIPHIHAAGLARGIKYSVISFDLPNSGYSETFDHNRIPGQTRFPAGLGSSEPIRTPILDFEEDFVVAFVDALESITPVKGRFAGVIGGSLGGNLGLRLGRRKDPEARRWLKAGIVSWSAASVWAPMIEDFLRDQGPGKAVERSVEPEAPSARADYFFNAYDYVIPIVDRKPPGMWYRDGWPCRDAHIAASRDARREIYSENFRRWHWRLAGDQLVYSHVDRFIRGDANSPFRHEDNVVRQLLVAGEDDDYKYGNIFGATIKLAKEMGANPPGRSLFLAKTGHSIHVERPRYFAGEIVRFLAETPPATPDMSFLEPLLLSDPDKPVTPDISFIAPLLLSG
jgi:pimeloyl-ACP methyl ester carboxylesterase